jgi:hypothetical protein
MSTSPSDPLGLAREALGARDRRGVGHDELNAVGGHLGRCARGDHDARAAPRELRRDRRADAAGAAGHDYAPAEELALGAGDGRRYFGDLL